MILRYEKCRNWSDRRHQPCGTRMILDGPPFVVLNCTLHWARIDKVSRPLSDPGSQRGRRGGGMIRQPFHPGHGGTKPNGTIKDGMPGSSFLASVLACPIEIKLLLTFFLQVGPDRTSGMRNPEWTELTQSTMIISRKAVLLCGMSGGGDGDGIGDETEAWADIRSDDCRPKETRSDLV
ncbi:uncharacterized protein BO97DRAFT_148475 [Aspergillus homomorphus CBS 101889]|uniref:Uncharacterized protein n=1 Tax=Aspergillus homomorphus (strain CBS 101889) TaxID=1450537 RepID=A0A395HQJ8_ASPHC|nr:hypothetical protein BO97DRAFT_148475 [Aspergillus homomorphus CBS 101889]RAL10097.1 hypothetical protein BO97DRAFT_148475 [Aspergillus homomorphus CBS 101889]